MVQRICSMKISIKGALAHGDYFFPKKFEFVSLCSFICLQAVVFVAEVAGLHDIVTFRGKTSQILCDYFNIPIKDDEEAHKTVIIVAAATFIRYKKPYYTFKG